MSEFFHMGGYASYVWSSYGLALVILLPMLLLPIRDKKRLINQIKSKQKREQAIARQKLEQAADEQNKEENK